MMSYSTYVFTGVAIQNSVIGRSGVGMLNSVIGRSGVGVCF